MNLRRLYRSALLRRRRRHYTDAPNLQPEQNHSYCRVYILSIFKAAAFYRIAIFPADQAKQAGLPHIEHGGVYHCFVGPSKNSYIAISDAILY
jgi:hypothetical protein